jgi:alpha-mannosidase
VIDKRSGVEMVKKDSKYVFGGYMYERFSRENTDSYAKDYIKGGWEWAFAELGRPNLTDDKYLQVHPVPYNVEYEYDNIKVSAIMYFRKDAQNPHDFTLEYSLYTDRPYLEIRWGILGKSPEAWPEGGWISFPFNAGKPEFRLGRLGAVVDPLKDFIKNSNLDYCFVNSGVAVTEGGKAGFVVSSPDVPAVSLDRPGLWRFSKDFKPSEPNVFFNLFNNQWSTNFTEWIEGSWNASFYVWAIGNYENEASLITPSEELRVPLLAEFAPGSDGSLPVSAKGIELSMKGVFVSAFGKNPNGDGLLLRLWEQSGNSGTCTVTLPEGLDGSTALPVNLRGEAQGKPIRIKDRNFSLDITGYQPRSFVITR